MARFADAVVFTPAAGGTTDWTFSASVIGYNTPTTGNMVSGLYKYRAESANLTQWEEGEGTYNSGTGVLTRTTVLYNSSGTGTVTPGQTGAGSKINFTVAPNVGIVMLKEDTLAPDEANAFTAAQKDQMQQNLGIPTVMQGWINGLTLSTAGSSATFSVAAGNATDSSATDVLILGSAISKTTSAWAVGSGSGGLDTGSIANNTWYHAFLIKRVDTQVVDVLVSLSASLPTLPTNYTLSRRIGAMKTNGSGQWTAFTQYNGHFFWTAKVSETVTQPSANTDLTVTLSGVPTGIRVQPYIRVSAGNSSPISSWAYVMRSPDLEPSLASLISGGGSAVASFGITTNVGRIAGQHMPLFSNTSAQVTFAGDVTQTVFGINTFGWYDDRGSTGNFAGTPQSFNLPTLLQGYLSGLTLSTAGASTTFSVATGVACDSVNQVMMALTASISKTTSAWAVGTGNGGLDTGSIAASTWYHAYLIYRADTQVVDALVSLSASAPTLPAGYTNYRRIGSMKTDGSSQWLAFVQNGNEFLWAANVVDKNAVAVSTSASLIVLSVPTGVKVNALFHGGLQAGSAAVNLLFSSLDENDVAPFGLSGGGNGTLQAMPSAYNTGDFNKRTDTSAQIRVRGNTVTGSPTYYVYTYGWIDNRGAATTGGQISVPLSTRTVLTSGSGTYNTPVGCRRIRVNYVGGGGGGAGCANGVGPGVAGTDGVKSTFNGIDAAPGKGGNVAVVNAGQASVGGAGGSGGSGSATRRMPGQPGMGSGNAAIAVTLAPGAGGSSVLFGGGGAPAVDSGTHTVVGTAGAANTGGGGSGAYDIRTTNNNAGSGGGAGECVLLEINNPAASYTYAVGTGGAGGVASTNGGAGGSGVIEVEEFY